VTTDSIVVSFDMTALASCAINMTCDANIPKAIGYDGMRMKALKRVSSAAALICDDNGRAYKAILVGGHLGDVVPDASTILSLHVEKQHLHVSELLPANGASLRLNGMGLLGAQAAYHSSSNTLFIYGGYDATGFQDKLYQAGIDTCPGNSSIKGWHPWQPCLPSPLVTSTSTTMATIAPANKQSHTLLLGKRSSALQDGSA
jgi:hypothetical protein